MILHSIDTDISLNIVIVKKSLKVFELLVFPDEVVLQVGHFCDRLNILFKLLPLITLHIMGYRSISEV